MPRIGLMPRCYLVDIAEGRMDLFEWLRRAQALEPEGHELHAAFFAAQEPAYAEKTRRLAEELGTPVFSLCYAPDFTRPDPDARAEEIRRQEEAIRLAAQLGATVCRTLSGQRRQAVDIDQGIEWVVECIDACLPTAEECGVRLALENHYKDAFWQQPEFAQKAEVFLRILERLDSPTLGVQFDPSNAILAGDDPLELLRAVAGRLVTVHASDRSLEPGASLDDLREADGTLGYSPKLRHGQVGQGLNDYDAIFAILREAGFDGWISVEDGDTMEAMGASIRFLKGMRERTFGA
ncbi:MAG: sugar phosphate isomerase/epimerase family protein [Candidatus Brocadiia bacterium]